MYHDFKGAGRLSLSVAQLGTTRKRKHEREEVEFMYNVFVKNGNVFVVVYGQPFFGGEQRGAGLSFVEAKARQSELINQIKNNLQ